MTFTLPQDLVTEFVRRVPSSSRSSYVAAAIASRMQVREAQLIHACETANASTEVLDIERAFDGLEDAGDRIQEPW